jgi:hypothetical protein
MTQRTYHGITLVLRMMKDGEIDLESEFRAVAERHRVDHEIHHVAADLARWCAENLEAIASLSERYGGGLERHPEPREAPGPVGVLREEASELLGRRPEAGLLLLRDLQRLYTMASSNSALWIMLGQGAQAIRDVDLLDAVTACHARTLRQVAWCHTMIKALSPQALTA